MRANLGYALGAEPPVLEVYIKMPQALGQTVLDPVAQQVALGAATRANAAGLCYCRSCRTGNQARHLGGGRQHHPPWRLV
jgi:hypothetical protein